MFGDDASSDNSREQPKSSRGAFWKDKLKDKASKLAKRDKSSRSQNDQEVSDFLRPSSESTASSANNPPRLDTSVTVPYAGSHEDQLPNTGYVALVRKKRQKPPGLHVTFTEDLPQVIGEGGDEADAPTMDVTAVWEASGQTYDFFNHGESNELSRKDSLPTPNLLQPGVDPRTGRRVSIQRAPTRHVITDSLAHKRRSMSQEEGLVQASKAEDEAEGIAPVDTHSSGQSSDAFVHSNNVGQPLEPSGPLPLEYGQTSSLPHHPGGATTATHIPQFTDKPYVSAPQRTTTQGSVETQGSTQSEFVPFNPNLKRQPTLPTGIDHGGELSDSSPPPLNTQHIPQRSAQGDHYENVVESPQSIESRAPQIRLPLDHTDQQRAQGYSGDRLPSPQAPAIHERRSRQQSPVDGSTAAKAEAAAEDLYSRLQHLRGTFRLAAEKVDDAAERSLSLWLRASSWWFLRGRSMLESSIRAANQNNRPGSSSGEPELPKNKQCYVDLAKSLWIAGDVIPDLLDAERAHQSRNPDKIDGLTLEHLFEVHQNLLSELNLFSLSLQKRNLFPPPALMIQGADPLIWLPYPRLHSGTFATTAGLDPRSLAKFIPPGDTGFFAMPPGDTKRHFCYGRVFGEVELIGDDETHDEDFHFPSMVTILRCREQSHVEFMISSQDGQINVHVQTDRRLGPTWDDVEWKIKTHSLRIRLGRDLGIVVRLWETDFKTLYGINDHNKRVEKDRQPKDNEEILYKEFVGGFHYFPAKGTQTNFPANLLRNCQIRLFQTNVMINDGSGERSAFNGYRIVAVTPPYIKTLSSLSRTIGDGTPIVVNKVTGDGGAPALGLHVYDGPRRESIFLTFDSMPSRSLFQGILSGVDPSSDEVMSDDLPFDKFTVSKLPNAPPDSGPCDMPTSIQWQNLRVINQGLDLVAAPILLSNRLRICMMSNHGTVTDRINLGTGDLRIGLDTKDLTLIKLYRPPQRNLTVLFSEVELKKDPQGPQAVQRAVTTAAQLPSARVYHFKSLPSLHDFQAVVTGFSVIYDGRAKSFTISKRTPLVPVYKKTEASLARIQIIRDDNLIQLVAFLDEFVHGRCMNWVLKGTDRCEAFTRSGIYCIRFVDCKFAMPKPEGDECWDMLSIDQVEYPIEHEDIVIGFASEDERELFTRAMPATVTKASKMSFMK